MAKISITGAYRLTGASTLLINNFKIQVVQTISKIRQELGEITMLFHCCGIPNPRTELESPPEIRRTFEISVLSHFWVCFTKFYDYSIQKIYYIKDI